MVEFCAFVVFDFCLVATLNIILWIVFIIYKYILKKFNEVRYNSFTYKTCHRKLKGEYLYVYRKNIYKIKNCSWFNSKTICTQYFHRIFIKCVAYTTSILQILSFSYTCCSNFIFRKFSICMKMFLVFF